MVINPIFQISLFKEWETLNNKYSKPKSFLKNKYRLRGRIKRIEYLGGGPYDMGIIGLWAGSICGPLYNISFDIPSIEKQSKPIMVRMDNNGDFIYNY